MSHIDKVAITPFHSLDRYPNLKIQEDFKDENWNQLYLQKFQIFTSWTHHYRQFVRFSFSPNPFVFIVFILFLFLFYVLFLVCYRPSWSHWTKFRPKILSGKEMQMAKCFNVWKIFLKIWQGFFFCTTRRIIFLAMFYRMDENPFGPSCAPSFFWSEAAAQT